MIDYRQLIRFLTSKRVDIRAEDLPVLYAHYVKLAECLGSPQSRYHTIHIAGTSGKGSVATKIAAALQRAGYRVGLFTSPHITTYRERFRINGIMASERALVDTLEYVIKKGGWDILDVGWFKLTTLLAFQYFADQSVDIAVLETGVGGRFDATNIVIPQLSVITSIGLDHTDRLGSTIKEITYHKAGIIKPGVPVVIGPRVSSAFIEEFTQGFGSPCYQVRDEFVEYDEENRAIAKMALDHLKPVFSQLSWESISEGIKAIPECRLHVFHKTILPAWQDKDFPAALVLDGAHNPDKLERFFSSLVVKYPGKDCSVIFNVAQNKNIPSCVDILKRYVSHLHLVEINNGGRATPLGYLLSQCLEGGIHEENISVYNDIRDGIRRAIQYAYQHDHILAACGTFCLMPYMYDVLGIHVETDPVPMEYNYSGERNMDNKDLIAWNL